MNPEQNQLDIALAKRIEAGLLAEAALADGTRPAGATTEELDTLAEEGRRAKDDLVLAHLGLVGVIAAETARRRRMSYPDLFQEGCLALQQAVMSYDWRKGGFGPYAGMWVRSAIRHVSSKAWVPLDGVDVEDLGIRRRLDGTVNRQGLGRMLDGLPRAESAVVRLRTGWSGRPLPRRQVADALGVTVSRVRRLEADGLRAIRESWQLAEAA